MIRLNQLYSVDNGSLACSVYVLGTNTPLNSYLYRQEHVRRWTAKGHSLSVTKVLFRLTEMLLSAHLDIVAFVEHTGLSEEPARKCVVLV